MWDGMRADVARDLYACMAGHAEGGKHVKGLPVEMGQSWPIQLRSAVHAKLIHPHAEENAVPHR